MMRRVGLAVLAMGLMSATALGQQRYVAFGDSLSDNGNFFAATGQPPAPYFNGRFSNGPTWVEVLAGPMGGFFPIGPVNNGTSTNFAFGGARTDGAAAPPGSPPNISGGSGAQIANYLARGGSFGANDRVTLWAGANNIFQGLSTTLPLVAGGVITPAQAQATMQAIATAAATDVAMQVGQLAGAGARQIIVFNLPSFSSVPQFLGGPAAPLAGFASSVFNQALGTAVPAAAAGANVTLVDVASVFAALQGNPAAFGFTDATSNCTTTPACVLNPAARDQFVFWDGVHPTAAGHRLVAAVASQYLMAPVLGGVYAALGETAIEGRRAGAGRAFDRLDLARAGRPGVNSYFVSLYGDVSDSRATGSRPSLSAGSYGVSFGFDRTFSDTLAFTAGASVGLGSIKSGGILSSDTFNAALDAGAIYASGPFFAKAGVGLGFTRFDDMERRTIGPLFNTASPHALSYNAALELGLNQAFGAVELSPRARLGWFGASIGAVNEAGSVAPLAISRHSASAFVAGAELRLSTKLVETQAQQVRLTGLVGYERYIGYTGNALTARLLGNAVQPFRVASGDPRGPGVILGAGVSVQTAGGLGISLDYRAAIGESRQVRHSGQLAVRAAF